MAAKKKTAARKPARTRATGSRGRAGKAAPARKAAARKPAGRKRAARKPALTARKQPESLRLRGAAVGITANDLERSMAWYCDVLGFTPRQRFEREGTLHGIQLVAGTVEVYLAQDDWKKGRDRQKGQGFRVYFTTAQSVDAIAARAREKGATLDEEPWDTPWETRTFAITDPDGFKISFESEA